MKPLSLKAHILRELVWVAPLARAEVANPLVMPVEDCERGAKIYRVKPEFVH